MNVCLGYYGFSFRGNVMVGWKEMCAGLLLQKIVLNEFLLKMNSNVVIAVVVYHHHL